MKRRISMDLSGGGGGGGGDVVRVTAPLCGVMIALVAVAIPLWVCAMSASNAPWLDQTDQRGARDSGSNTLQDYHRDMESKTGASGSVLHHKRRANTGRLMFYSDRYEFAMVTDLDKRSRHPEKHQWKAFLKKGVLSRSSPEGNFSVSWGATETLTTHTATKNRSMELSDIVRFNRNFFAGCDMTGIIFKVNPDTGRVFQRYAIADGNGDEPKPFKIEWATVKDNLLWVGSVGKEISDTLRPAEWVKTIDTSGDVSNIDWGPIYQVLRTATNTSFPGYLWHEAIHFDHRTRTWVILPRKVSYTGYDEHENEMKGGNLLIQANEDFTEIVVKRVGPLQPEYGFTAVRKLPGTDMYVALKVKETEVPNIQHTVITVFDSEGNIRMDPPFVHVADFKYEGIEFLNVGNQITATYV